MSENFALKENPEVINYTIIEHTSENYSELKNTFQKIESKFLFGHSWANEIINFEIKIGSKKKYYWTFEYLNEDLISVTPIYLESFLGLFHKAGIVNNYYSYDVSKLLPKKIDSFTNFIFKKFKSIISFSITPAIEFDKETTYSLLAKKPYTRSLININHLVKISTFSDYWSNRPKKLINTVKRKTKCLTSKNCKFEIVTSPCASQINDYWQVYNNSWKISEPDTYFVNWVINHHANCHKLFMGFFYIDGQPAAAQIWLVNDDSYHIFKLAQDKKYDTLSPGTLLTEYMIKTATNTKNTEINFLLGDDEYKKMWMDDSEKVYHFTLYRNYFLMKLAKVKNKTKGIISHEH